MNIGQNQCLRHSRTKLENPVPIIEFSFVFFQVAFIRRSNFQLLQNPSFESANEEASLSSLSSHLSHLYGNLRSDKSFVFQQKIWLMKKVHGEDKKKQDELQSRHPAAMHWKA